MKWYNRLYVGDSIKNKTEKVKWKINHNAGQIEIFVICLASSQENLLDIIPAAELLQKYYPKRDMFIIGLARGRDEAFELVTKIVEEVYLQTGDVRLREYFGTHSVFREAGRRKL